MAHTISIVAERRNTKGKGAARQLRLKGRVPAVIYGHGREPESLSIGAFELKHALVGVAAESTVIDLAVDGTPVKALIREIQRHPVRPEILHVDFYEIHSDEKIRLEIPIHCVGTPEGVRNAGGVLDLVLRAVEIEILPEHIPERVDLDVSGLGIAKSLHVRDVIIPHATILTDLDLTVCTVVPPRAEEVAPVTGEAVVEPTEPELIRKPKPDEEGEGEAEGEGKEA